MKTQHATAVVRATILLAAASASASRSFSVSDDVLAFPQYEIRFLDEWVSESVAETRLQRPSHGEARNHKDVPADAPNSQVGQYAPQSVLGDAKDGSSASTDDIEYEYMVLDGQRWLCAVPRVAPPDTTTSTSKSALNETQTRLDEERELVRATSRGWELLAGMAGNCVYFNAGWWTYRFCYDQGVKQFHQLPPGGNVPRYPPAEDPGVVGFVLGAYEKDKKDKKTQDGGQWKGESGVVEAKSPATPDHARYGELVQRGETRYLVQRLSGGTVCDLTGRERRIEVQFHCNPLSSDRISLIKEVSTCAYLMVVQTPRLCNDVAFQPPQKDHPHSVTCSPVLAPEEVADYEASVAAIKELDKEAELLFGNSNTGDDKASGTAAKPKDDSGRIVGDIVVGGRHLVPAGKTIPKSGIVGGAAKETYVDTLATSDGSRMLNKAELEKLGLAADVKKVERLKKELENLAAGERWRLDVIDTAGGREYRGIIGDDREEGDQDGEQTPPSTGATDDPQKKEKSAKGATTDAEEAKKSKKQQKRPPEGSEEEFFKEEL